VSPETLTQCGIPRAELLFALHLFEDGYDLRTFQELPVHEDVSTTKLDTHDLNCGGRAVRKPLDLLPALGGP